MEESPRQLAALAKVSVDRLRAIGVKRTAALAEMGITNVFDLLTWYPRRYIDRTKQVDLSDLTIGDEAAVFGEVTKVRTNRTKNGKQMVSLEVKDGSHSLGVVFFNQPWREKQLPVGTQAMFFGKVGEFRQQRQMSNPVVDVIIGTLSEDRDPGRVGRVVAIYPASGKAGLTSWEMGGFIEESLRRAGELADPLNETLRVKLGLVERSRAVHDIHLPSEVADVTPARRRLAFDEFWRLQSLLALRRQRLEEDASGIAHQILDSDLEVLPGTGLRPTDSLVRQFIAQHRFALTSAQRRVLLEIARDLRSVLPMHRLLQGDVGSGKTLVALTAMLAVRGEGHQSALMAPTEVLAEQHAASLQRDVRGLTIKDESVLGGERPVVVGLLTGSTKAKERQGIIDSLASGSIDILVGTHSLLNDEIRFASLGLVVIDEQHRFGVEQRAKLRENARAHSASGADPDLLVMTATPIPRTAAMVVFGDLDISTIDEMPVGRLVIETKWADSESAVEDCWRRVRGEIEKGQRAYVVCPLVDGSSKVEATSATAERTRLATGELRGLSVGLLHGQMKPEEKEIVMQQFRSGEIQVLVATTVIEVGVDVPEATVIVIEDAWRFGLAQLHQLRGRVGRGADQSYCYLLGPAPSEESATRLGALVGSNDGFALAEVDLALRGEGTLLGARQRGRSDLILASLQSDLDLLEAAREVATEMVARGDLTGVQEELRLFVDDEEATYLFRS